MKPRCFSVGSRDINDDACRVADPLRIAGCLGDDDNGRLGDPSLAGDQSTPGAAFFADAVRVTTGADHACAISSNRVLTCWGKGANGRLGFGLTSDVRRVEDVLAIGDAVVDVAAGGAHTCALLNGGGVVCFGEASSGALGYGNSNDIGDDELPSVAVAVF